MSRPGGGGIVTTTRSSTSPRYDARSDLPFTLTLPFAMSVAACVRDNSHACATRRSRRSPALSETTNSCVVGEASGLDVTSMSGGRLTRRVRQRLLPPFLFPQGEYETHGADRHRRIGDVECPEARVADADVDEIDDTIALTNAIEQVADGSADDDGHTDGCELRDARQVSGRAKQHRDDDETQSRKDPARRRPEMHAERGAR